MIRKVFLLLRRMKSKNRVALKKRIAQVSATKIWTKDAFLSHMDAEVLPDVALADVGYCEICIAKARHIERSADQESTLKGSAIQLSSREISIC